MTQESPFETHSFSVFISKEYYSIIAVCPLVDYFRLCGKTAIDTNSALFGS